MIWIGLDDTDAVGRPGTGHLARELAVWLGERFPVFGVTRHQLLQDPRVPMTAKNSAVAIHLQVDGAKGLADLAGVVAWWVGTRVAPGSDPGLCLAQEVPEPVVAFGQRAKGALVTQEEAWGLAARAGLILQGIGGNGGGVIGALAAVGLAASGSDGRFTLCGRLRELRGVQPISALLAAGVARVQAVTGEPLADGWVDTGGKLRPSLVGGLPVLWVERQGDRWMAVRRD
ncbi:MAG TPA: ABC transporter substrate-binding protein [Anaerolineales bacterium]|nr:ABC transporter substrate-binding protein [Anaerolineales bacterium]